MKVKFSDFLSLTKSDFVKGLIMAVGGAVYAIIADSIQQGNFVINFTSVWHTALAALVVYIGKQFFSPAPDTVVVDRSKTDVEYKK